MMGGMLVFVHYFFYISRDYEIYCPSFVIPLQINGKEKISLPILRHRLIVCIQCVEEIMCVRLPFVFHSKVIQHKVKLNLSCFVPPQPLCARCGAGSICCQSFLQEFIFQTTCLGQPIHSFICLKLDVTFLHKFVSLVLFH